MKEKAGIIFSVLAPAKRREKTILDLPHEILYIIFLFLKYRLRDMASIAKTCRGFKLIVSDPRFKITNRTIYQAEQLKETQLTECMADRDACERLTLDFSPYEDILGLKPAWWNESIARNLEESLPHLTTVFIKKCHIYTATFKPSSLPKNLKTLQLMSCCIQEPIPAKSLLFGLPYLPIKSTLTELMFSSWEDIRLTRTDYVQ